MVTEFDYVYLITVMYELNYITAFIQVCRKRRLKGGLERELMLLFCVGHTNLYNCISGVSIRMLYLELFDTTSYACG